MRRLLCLMLAVISTASAQAIHYGWRWIPDRGAVAPNDHDWTPFRDKILIGGYSGRALVCARYDTSFEVRNVVMTDPTGRKYIGQVEQLITNWFEMFVLTNYPNARYFTVGQGLNPGFEAMRMWDTEVNLPITSPILDWSRLPPPQTNAAGVPVGYISQVCALYDYGVPCLPPGTGTATGDKGTNPLPPSRPVDRGNGEYGKGMDYLAEGDFVEALKWFLKADKKGHAGPGSNSEPIPTRCLWNGGSPTTPRNRHWHRRIPMPCLRTPTKTNLRNRTSRTKPRKPQTQCQPHPPWPSPTNPPPWRSLRQRTRRSKNGCPSPKSNFASSRPPPHSRSPARGVGVGI